MAYAATIVLGYLLGSIPFALLTARAHGVDLRATGDGNPGAWNALEQLGARRAWPAFAGDGVKGAAAGFAGLALAGVGGAYAGVAAAMVGHAFPLFAGLRGGKSVMTFAGGMVALSLPAALVSGGAGLLAGLVLRSPALGARVAVFGFPAAQLLFAPPGRVAATGALMTFIGARFLVDRRSARARSATAASPTTSARR